MTNRKMTDEVIALLNDKFVPYAPSSQMAAEYKADKYEWKAAIFKKYKEMKNECIIPGTGWYSVTSAGQVLPGRKAGKGGQENLAATLEEILRMYARLPESERKPAEPITDVNRPNPAPPPGGLVLTIYDHPIKRTEDGQYRKVTGKMLGDAQRDSLWLTAAECQALMPETPKQGASYRVPSKLAKRIFLFGLVPFTAWEMTYEWRGDSVRAGELQLTVEEVAASGVRLRIHGSTLLASKASGNHDFLPKDFENRYDACLQGVIVYDPTQKKITRWDMVALGDYVGFNAEAVPYNAPERDRWAVQPIAMAFSFELDQSDYELPAERRRAKPYLLAWWFQRDGFVEDYYWDPEKWHRNK